jgi:hypothetical protein
LDGHPHLVSDPDQQQPSMGAIYSNLPD